jgi:hypothetical protein
MHCGHTEQYVCFGQIHIKILSVMIATINPNSSKHRYRHIIYSMATHGTKCTNVAKQQQNPSRGSIHNS